MSDSSTVERCGQEANGTNGPGGKSRRPKEPTKAELRARLEEAEARAELAEAGLLARRMPGDHVPEALLAPAEGVCRCWVMTHDNAYRISLTGMEPARFLFTKWSDGTRYTVTEKDGELRCSCPGGSRHGPRCSGGRGCKHARLLRAVRQLVDPGL